MSSYTAMIFLCAAFTAVTNALFVPIEPHNEVHEEIGNIADGGGIGSHEHHEKDYYSPPHYSYEYKIHDSHTGDMKTHHESRVGDEVKGYYTMREADGTMREVHYTADKHNGFKAEVKTIGKPIHPAPAYHQHSEPVNQHQEEFAAATGTGGGDHEF